MKEFIWLLETVFLFIFSYIIPKDKNLILFGSMKTKYIWGNPKIYYLYMHDRYWDKYNIFFCDPHQTNTDSRIKTYGNWLKKYWLLLRAKTLIIDACSFDLWISWVFSGNFNIIQMWHWEPIKKIGFLSDLYISRRNPIILFFEKLEYKTYKLILSNPWSIKILEWCFQNKNVEWIWVPRNDLLLHKDILNLVKNTEVEKQIFEWKKQYKNIILLAPTFRETDSSDYFTKNEVEELNKTLKKNNYLLIIKTHPNETRSFLDKKYSNIKNVTKSLNYDATDFTPFIDVVMTDYSSIYIDFLLSWKPIVWYQNDLKEYIYKERGLLYSPKDVTISETTAHSFQELLNKIQSLETSVTQKSYKNNYTQLYNLFFKGLNTETSTCEKLDNTLLHKK